MAIFMGKKFIEPHLEKMARAIMDFEGWEFDSVSVKNNNPGNLKNVGQAGVVGTDSEGHAIFESFELGWNALINQLKLAFENRSRIYKSTDTLYDFFGKYAKANSRPYAEYVARQLGVNPNATLDNISLIT